MDTKREGLWAIVHCYTQKFVGCINMIRDDNPNPEKITKDLILASDWVRLSPLYDYFSPMRPVQVPGPDGRPAVAMTRDQFATPFENFLHDGAHWVRATGFSFFDEMHADDRDMLQRFLDRVDQQRVEARAAASGITLASIGGPLPSRLHNRG